MPGCEVRWGNVTQCCRTHYARQDSTRRNHERLAMPIRGIRNGRTAAPRSATDGVVDKQYCWRGIASRANRRGDDGSERARPGQAGAHGGGAREELLQTTPSRRGHPTADKTVALHHPRFANRGSWQGKRRWFRRKPQQPRQPSTAISVLESVLECC